MKCLIVLFGILFFNNALANECTRNLVLNFSTGESYDIKYENGIFISDSLDIKDGLVKKPYLLHFKNNKLTSLNLDILQNFSAYVLAEDQVKSQEFYLSVINSKLNFGNIAYSNTGFYQEGKIFLLSIEFKMIDKCKVDIIYTLSDYSYAYDTDNNHYMIDFNTKGFHMNLIFIHKNL